MSTIEEQIKDIEKEIRETPYHKGTEHYIGRLRAKLVRLKDRQLEVSIKKGGGIGYAVKKQGDATIVLVGPPSVGKSTLLNKLTNAKSKIAPYEFTTVSVIPGMMEYKNAKIQILDVPGLIEGAEEGKGRGREVLSVARGSDLLIIMTDIERVNAVRRIKEILEKNGIRLNIVRPNIRLEKKVSGGIIIHSNLKQDLSKDTIKTVISELGIKNAEITLMENVTIKNLIDALSKSRVYLPSISVINKKDLLNKTNFDLDNDVLLISAEKDIGIDNLKERILEHLSFVNVFLVRLNEQPDYNHPLVTKNGETLHDVACKIGTDFVKEKTRAKIWGNGAKFPGQEVSLETIVQNGMQVRFI